MLSYSFGRLPHDETWGVKVTGNIAECYDLMGREVTVTKRDGTQRRVLLGVRVMSWNAGRAALYEIARDLAPRAPRDTQFNPREEQPARAPEQPADHERVTEPGVYENDEGIFVVKYNRARTRLYAKRLVEINAQRATEVGERVNIEFVYAPGVIYRLRPEQKMDLERARELTIRYGRCLVCGRRLRAAESVERGIGPVCIQSFRPVARAGNQRGARLRRPVEIVHTVDMTGSGYTRGGDPYARIDPETGLTPAAAAEEAQAIADEAMDAETKALLADIEDTDGFEAMDLRAAVRS